MNLFDNCVFWQVARTLYQTLMMQLIHWFTTGRDRHMDVLLDTLMVALLTLFTMIPTILHTYVSIIDVSVHD